EQTTRRRSLFGEHAREAGRSPLVRGLVPSTRCPETHDLRRNPEPLRGWANSILRTASLQSPSLESLDHGRSQPSRPTTASRRTRNRRIHAAGKAQTMPAYFLEFDESS